MGSYIDLGITKIVLLHNSETEKEMLGGSCFAGHPGRGEGVSKGRWINAV